MESGDNMDHMMPEMDGIEAAMREMFLEKGFDDFLAKPIDGFRLNEIMGRWIDRDKWDKAQGI